jgi:tripartite-type tricarboxylate transporter receptor subunit TctC
VDDTTRKKRVISSDFRNSVRHANDSCPLYAYQGKVSGLSRRGVIAAALIGWMPARAQPSNRPLRIILAGPPGGIIDVGGRAIADALAQALGQPVVLDHRPGAAGMIAAQIAAAAAPNGNTLLLTVSEITAIQFLTPIAFDLASDLTPVATIGEGSALACVGADLQVHDLRSLIEYAVAHPQGVHYLNPGNGTRQHLIPEQINRAFGTGMISVPYRGLPPGVVDLIAGRIQFGIVSTALALSHVSARALRPIAFLGQQRLAELPGLPTIEEQGLGRMHVRSTLSLFGPRGLPAPIVARLNRAVAATVDDPQTRERLRHAYIEIEVSQPDDLGRRLASEQEELGSLVRTLNLRPE